jgi:hypothetical protein
MLAHPTLDRLNAMGLAGMAKAFGELVANGEVRAAVQKSATVAAA